MPTPSIGALARRWQSLLAERSQREPEWQAIIELIVPHKRQWRPDQMRAQGEKATRRLFDSTAIHAHKLLAASLHGTLTPSTQPWLSLTMRDDALNELQPVKEWLEDTATRLHKALRQSNFNNAVHEMYLDLTSFATGCLFVEEKAPVATGQFAGFRFRAFGIGEYAIAQSWENRVDTLFRKVKLTARACLQNPAWTPSSRVTALAESKPDAWVDIVHAVFPRTDRTVTSKRASQMPWASVYFELETKHKLAEGGFEEFPYMVPRWNLTSGEDYGDGPSHTALPDVESINAAKEWILKSLPLAIQPPTVERDDAVLNEPDLTPAGRNVISGTGPVGDLFAFMDTKFRPDVANFTLNDLRAGIRDMYFSQQLELQDGPQMTATEVQVRYELMQRLLGPTVGRLETEFLNPLVERCFAIMARANALKELPAELAQLGAGADLDIEYEGPLARAQRTIELTAQDRVLGFALQLATVGHPEIFDDLDLSKMLRARAAVTGLPTDQLRDPDMVKLIQAERARQQAQQDELAQGATIAKAAGDAAPGIRELNAMATQGRPSSPALARPA